MLATWVHDCKFTPLTDYFLGGIVSTGGADHVVGPWVSALWVSRGEPCYNLSVDCGLRLHSRLEGEHISYCQ